MKYVWTESIDEKTFRMGLTREGVQHLGDIGWIELPMIGALIQKEEPLFVVESSKAAIEIESPLVGYVRAVQPCSSEFLLTLLQSPESVWLVELAL